MNFERLSYAECKTLFVRMAGLVSRANSAPELAALLLADTAAPYHTFDPTAYPTLIANLADRIGMLMFAAMDDGEEEAVA